LQDKRPEKVWDSIRKILKKTGYTNYYNRIPTILEVMGYEYKIDWVRRLGTTNLDREDQRWLRLLWKTFVE